MPRTQTQPKDKHVEKTLQREPTRSKTGKTGTSGRSTRSGSAKTASQKDGARNVHEHRVAKVVELVASSTEGFEQAIQNAVTDACRSIHGVHGCDVRNMSVSVRDGKIVEYKVDLKLAFGIDRSPSP